ncbi:MAG: hypothetical protein V1738_04175 [Patescibacteria group bacterium]
MTQESWPLVIKLGRSGSSQALRESIEKNNVVMSCFAGNMLDSMTVTTKKTVVRLVQMLDTDLGFDAPYTIQNLLDRAVERGYDLCPAECGPLVRLAHTSQTSVSMLIGMRPIAGSDGKAGIFEIYRGSIEGKPVLCLWAIPEINGHLKQSSFMLDHIWLLCKK